jgi:hypothetical protein
MKKFLIRLAKFPLIILVFTISWIILTFEAFVYLFTGSWLEVSTDFTNYLDKFFKEW